jgi:hypothetical protein
MTPLPRHDATAVAFRTRMAPYTDVRRAARGKRPA